MYENADHSAERVVRGDEEDGPDVDAKDQNSRTVIGYADSADLIRKDQRGSRVEIPITGFPEQMETRLRTDMQIHADGTFRFGNRIYVPKGKVQQEVLSEAHSLAYSLYLGGTKMYQNLKQRF